MVTTEVTDRAVSQHSMLAAGVRWPEALAACGAAVMFPALLGLISGSFGPTSQAIRSTLALTSMELGLLGGGYLLAIALGQLVAGPLIDRFGVRKLSMSAFAGIGIAAAGFARAESLGVALALYLVMGAATAVAVPAFGAVAVRVTSSGGFAVAMGGMAVTIGLVSMGSTWVGAAARDGDGWRGVFWLVAAAAIPGIIAVGFALRGPRFAPIASAAGPSRSTVMVGLIRVATVRRAILIAIGLAGLLFSFGGIWNSYVVRVIWQLPAEDWGLVTSMFYLGYSIMNTITPCIALRLGAMPVLRISTGCAFVLLSVWLLSPIALTATGAAIVAGALGASLSGIALNTALAVRSVPLAQAGSCVALVGSAGLFSGFAMQFLPTLTTHIEGTTPLSRGLICGSVITLVVGIGHAATYRRQASANSKPAATTPGS